MDDGQLVSERDELERTEQRQERRRGSRLSKNTRNPTGAYRVSIGTTESEEIAL
jgi:hypothetical protein